MPNTASPKRRRLTPELRREEILNQAAQLVLAEGVSAVSMERIGREAGASKALVYAYFSDRTGLLTALLLREQARFRAEGQRLLQEAKDFESKVRATTAAWLLHVAHNGALIERLLHEPEVARAVEPDDARSRSETTSYFGDEIAHHYGLPQRQAVVLADLLMGLTGAAGARLHSTNADPDEVLELTLRMIFAALRAVSSSGAQRAGEESGENDKTRS
jgi:AcrR family transcriptional regulator